MKYKYYYRNGIKPEYLSYIDNALWYTGAIDINDNSIVSNRNFTANNVYAQERGNKVGDKCKTSQDPRYAYYTYCNDTVNRTTTWVGKVGLMYLSDYAYTDGGVNGREACFKENLYTATNTANSVAGAIYNDNNGCISKDSWLYESYSQSMFLNPFAYSSYAIYNMHKGQFGTINLVRASNYEGRPAVYLKSDVKITGGDGTILNPYTITR